MSFRVLVSQRAKRDIREIATWISNRSRKGAVSWLDALEKAMVQLSETATSCVFAPEAADFYRELRQLLFKTRRGNPYRLVFMISNDSVHILSVRGTGQDFLQSDEIDLPES